MIENDDIHQAFLRQTVNKKLRGNTFKFPIFESLIHHNSLK